ncbi:MAG TPA: carbohydrate binding domain-containing protein [Planctomycetota bacterium]
MRLIAAFALLALIPQEEKTFKIDDFEGELAGWTLFKLEGGAIAEDGESKIAVVKDGAKAGKGALAYTHEVTAGVIRVLGRQGEIDLSGMKSLRFWVKSSAATAVVVSLTERNGAGYQAAFSVGTGAWQEVAVNLDEFAADDPAKDDNGKLDLDQIASFHLFDFAGFLAALVPDTKGTRTLGLDDVRFSSKPVPFTTGFTSATKVVPVHLVDNFESPVIRWSPLSVEFGDALKINLYDAPVAVDTLAPPTGGKQALKFSYPRKAAKAHAIMRSVEKIKLDKAASLELWLRVSHDGTYIVNLEEKDGSRYDKVVELRAADGWTAFAAAFGEFALAQDSQDENGRLDGAEIKQIVVADATALLGGAAADEVRLWIDEVRFILSP